MVEWILNLDLSKRRCKTEAAAVCKLKVSPKKYSGVGLEECVIGPLQHVGSPVF